MNMLPLWVTFTWSGVVAVLGFTVGWAMARNEWPWTSAHKRLARRRKLSQSHLTIKE